MVKTRPATAASGADEDDGSAYLHSIATTLQTTLEQFQNSGNHINPSKPLQNILSRAIPLLSSQANHPSSPSPPPSSQTCTHACASHAPVMNPSTFSQLPKDVLIRVFAQLPVIQINALKLLSNEWRAEFANPTGAFLQECDRVHPIIALLTRVDRASNRFMVRLFDIKYKQWYAFPITAGDITAADITAASSSEGLVCFVSSKKKSRSRSFVVDVVNPLLQQASALPVLNGFGVLHMVEIRVKNGGGKDYSVLAVGDGVTGKLKSMVFDQSVSANRWSTPPKTRSTRYGNGFWFGNFRYNHKRDNPCSFNALTQTLHRISRALIEAAGVCSHAMLENKLFILRKDRRGPNVPGKKETYIVEYEMKLGEAEELVRRGVIRCLPFEVPPKAKYEMTMFACEGYLMVWARLLEEAPYGNQVGWLYDLGTLEWCHLPSLPGKLPYHVNDLMCRLRWNIAV